VAGTELDSDPALDAELELEAELDVGPDPDPDSDVDFGANDTVDSVARCGAVEAIGFGLGSAVEDEGSGNGKDEEDDEATAADTGAVTVGAIGEAADAEDKDGPRDDNVDIVNAAEAEAEAGSKTAAETTGPLCDPAIAVPVVVDMMEGTAGTPTNSFSALSLVE
jgi:hypothetical protein